MIGRRRAEVHDVPGDLDAVWATDSIPIDDAPTEFDWSTSNREAEPDPGDVEPPSRRGKVVGAGIAAGLLLTVGAIVVWPNSDASNDESADLPDSPPATFDTLPGAQVTTIPDTDTGTLDEEPAPEGDPDNVGDVDLPAGDLLDAADAQSDNAAQPLSIELPLALAAVSAPTEVVMTTEEGLITLSLPSGNLRFTNSEGVPRFQGGSVIVAPDAAAYTYQDTITIVSREGAVFEVDTSPDGGDLFLSGWLTDDNGKTVFRASLFRGNGEQLELIVSVEDGVTELPGSSNAAETFLRTASGGIVNDTGGVYRTDPDGSATRASSGRAFAANGDHVLLRECDEFRSCTVSVLDLVTDERVPVDGGDEALGNAFSLDLAPDGSAFSRLAPETSGPGVRQIVTLDGTVVAETETSGFFTSGSTWMADSSGIIDPMPNEDGLRFLDRSTGGTVSFGQEELGRVFSYGVRYPDTELPPLIAGPVESPIALSTPLTVSTGLDLVVFGDAGRMAYLDLDTRTAVAWPAPRVGGLRPPEMFVQGNQITVVGPGENSGFTARFGSTSELDGIEGTGSFPPAPRIVGPSPELVWAERGPDVSGVNHRLVVIDGSLPASDGPELIIENSTLLGSDGTGGLLAEIGGDIFSVGADGQNRITAGELLALSVDHALVRECNDQLNCAVSLLGRESGSLTPITNATLRSAAPVTTDRVAPTVGTISPDATAFLVQEGGDDDDGTWVVVDVRNQTRTTIPRPDERQPLVWNDRSTYMVFVAGEVVHIYDRTNARLSTVEGLGSVRAIAGVGPDFAGVETPAEPVEG